MFMGEYSHTIDAKGRLIIPSKFREELGDEFVLTKGLDGCLSIYELDRQGRILVPATLREFGGLEKDVVLTGNLNRIEVWSKAKWSENNDYDDMDAIAEDMQEMGIII